MTELSENAVFRQRTGLVTAGIQRGKEKAAIPMGIGQLYSAQRQLEHNKNIWHVLRIRPYTVCLPSAP